MNHENWVDAVSTDELRPDDVIGIVVANRDIAIYLVAGEVYASDDSCTHGQARLCDGFLDGHEIECPMHQGRFDVRDGTPRCEPASDALRTYPVKIVGQRVHLRLD